MSEKIEVAVYWPGEGYGIPERAASMDEARAKCAELQKMGYINVANSKSEIHIIETTKTVTKYGGTP